MKTNLRVNGAHDDGGSAQKLLIVLKTNVVVDKIPDYTQKLIE